MADLTIDLTGDELTQVRAENPSPLPPIKAGGRVRVKQFSFTAADAVSTGSVIELLELPKNTTVLGGALTGATLNSTAKVALGIASQNDPQDDDSAVLLGAAGSAGTFKPYMTTTSEASLVYATTSSAALAANDTFEGYLLYVVNT